MSSTTNRIYLLLLLVVCMGIGMLTSSWRMVLYPYLVVIGIGFLFSLGRGQNSKRFLVIPAGATLLYFVLFLWLDVLGWDSISGGGDHSSYYFGLVPTTAVYLIGVSSTVIVFSLLYSWMLNRDVEVSRERKQEIGM